LSEILWSGEPKIEKDIEREIDTVDTYELAFRKDGQEIWEEKEPIKSGV